MRRSLWTSIDILAYSVLVIAMLNWGVAVLFETDLVAILLSPMSFLGRMVYGLVGLAALYDLASLQVMCKRCD